MIALAAGWLAIGVVTAIGHTANSDNPRLRDLFRRPRLAATPQSDLELGETPGDGLPRLDHYVCCRDDTTALCGLDVSGYPWGTEGGPHCVVCLDLNDQPACAITGRPCP